MYLSGYIIINHFQLASANEYLKLIYYITFITNIWIDRNFQDIYCKIVSSGDETQNVKKMSSIICIDCLCNNKFKLIKSFVYLNLNELYELYFFINKEKKLSKLIIIVIPTPKPFIWNIYIHEEISSTNGTLCSCLAYTVAEPPAD